MKLRNRLAHFLADENGATAEFVMLSAAGAFAFIAVIVYVTSGVETLHEDTKYQNRQQEAVTTF